jgi:hypothetical protein
MSLVEILGSGLVDAVFTFLVSLLLLKMSKKDSHLESISLVKIEKVSTWV